MSRTFEHKKGVRDRVPLLIGLAGPSGSGKTYSALQLATGMQKVNEGEIFVIDTENKRALHYADDFDFQHVDFAPPFGSLDYLAVLEHVAKNKPAAIVVDSLSHEHEGEGGLIDLHSQIVQRMAGNDYAKQQRVQMLAWKDPKGNRRKLLNGLIRLNCNVIMCFRAGEKSKPGKDKKTGKNIIIEQGFTPIAGSEFVYEMTVSTLFYPGSQGVPVLQSDKPGEYAAIKIPGQFQNLFKPGEQITPEHGRKLAEWAQGGEAPAKSAPARQEAAGSSPLAPPPPAPQPEESDELPALPKIDLETATRQDLIMWCGIFNQHLEEADGADAGLLWADNAPIIDHLKENATNAYDRLAAIMDAK
ncbi:MAG: AAA family ATPase [Henriciella sp.]